MVLTVNRGSALFTFSAPVLYYNINQWRYKMEETIRKYKDLYHCTYLEAFLMLV